MASNSNPTSSSSSAESPTEVIFADVLIKFGGVFLLGQSRFFVLRRNGTLDRYRLDMKEFKPTRSFTVLKFMQSNDPSSKPEMVLKVKCRDSGIVTLFKVRAQDLRKYNLWYSALQLQTTGVEVPTDKEEFAEIVNPSTEMESGPLNSNVTKDNFRIVKLLGSGAYGRVFLGKLNGGPDKYYAIKKLNKKKVIKKKQLEHTKTESRVLFFCKHPFLVSMAFAFQTEKNIYFVMDYCIGGDLYFHLRDSKSKFDEARVRFYAAEIAQALGFLHSNKIVHRDLKPENVLLDEEGHIKIADFGLCKENVDYENTTSTYCGTVQYIAPEVLQIDDYGCAVDWWALGVIVYEMVYRRLPFFHTDTAKLCKLITSDTPKFPGTINPDTQDFLTRLLQKDPEQRLGGTEDFAELQAHLFFKDKVNWDDLYDRKVRPPFVPVLRNAKMAKYFEKKTIYEPDVLADLHDDPIVVHPDVPELQRSFNRFSLHEKRESDDVPANDEPLKML